jgi:hypothetical protein
MFSTSITASTGLPSMFGSRSAIRLASPMAEASGTRHTTGTGKNSPSVVRMLLGDADGVGDVHVAAQRREVAAAHHDGVRWASFVYGM